MDFVTPQLRHMEHAYMSVSQSLQITLPRIFMCQVESDTDKNCIFTKTGAQRCANITKACTFSKGGFEKLDSKHLRMVRVNNCIIILRNITNKTEGICRKSSIRDLEFSNRC
ncbi:hypothetical protein Trydic_g5461 [Trypoxylus dichotomus]